MQASTGRLVGRSWWPWRPGAPGKGQARPAPLEEGELGTGEGHVQARPVRRAGPEAASGLV